MIHEFAIEEDLRDWKNESKSTKPLMFNVRDSVITVYTSQPGWLIGKGGELIDKYISILQEKHGADIDVKIIETAYTVL